MTTPKYEIKVTYKTEHGLDFSTYNEAILADRLYKEMYRSEYELRQIVEHVLKNFAIQERYDIPMPTTNEKEFFSDTKEGGEDEALPTS